MNPEIATFNQAQNAEDQEICERLASLIEANLPKATSKIWHRHPVWFLDENPTVGYSRLKAGVRLMFWSGADFGEAQLKPGTGKFKDASILYRDANEIVESDLKRWLELSQEIQWNYRDVYKTKGKLSRLQ